MTSFLKMTLVAGLSAATLVGAVTTSTAPAQARGGAIAAGVLGGLAVGAIAGSAASRSGYGDGYGYPAYAAPAPVYGGGCYFERRPVLDEDGEVIGHRRVRVCE